MLTVIIILGIIYVIIVAFFYLFQSNFIFFAFTCFKVILYFSHNH